MWRSSSNNQYLLRRTLNHADIKMDGGIGKVDGSAVTCG